MSYNAADMASIESGGIPSMDIQHRDGEFLGGSFNERIKHYGRQLQRPLRTISIAPFEKTGAVQPAGAPFPIEGSLLEKTLPDTRPPQAEDRPQLSRRGFFQAAAGLVALASLGEGVRLPTKEYVDATNEYLKGDQPINFVFIDHTTNPTAVYKDYVENGGFNHTVWNKAAVQDMVTSMKAAKQRGEDAYFCMIDGVNSIPYVPNTDLSLQNLNWTLIPHPPVADLKVSNRNEYPERFYVIGADIMNNNFGLDDLINRFPDAATSLTNLTNDLNARYQEPSLNEIIVKGLEIAPGAIAKKLAEGALTVGLLTTALAKTPEMTKRRVLQLIPPVVAAEVLKGLSQAGAPALLTGIQSSPDAQKISTVLGNITGWSIGDKPEMLYANARTALMVQKADEMIHDPSRILSDYLPSITGGPHTLKHTGYTQNRTGSTTSVDVKDIKPTHITIDLGAFHQNHAPEIVANQNTRFDFIESYLNDLLQFTNDRVSQQFPELASHRNDILNAVASNIIDAEIFKIAMPWGKNTLKPQEVQDFEAHLSTPVASFVSEPLTKLVSKVLGNFGVKANL